MKGQHHPRPGYELDWLAVDATGKVGLLSSFGWGPVPRKVAEHLSEVEDAVTRLSALPLIGECAECSKSGGNYDFWTEAARRGAFGFDWGPSADGPFGRIAVPTVSINVDALPDARIQSAARLVQLPVDFSDVRILDLSSLGVSLFDSDGA